MSKNNADFFKVKNPWSVIKDRLLQCYLAPYFQKVLTTNKPIFYIGGVYSLHSLSSVERAGTLL